MLTLQGLPSDSTCIFEAEPGRLDIKRCIPGILFINLPVDSLFKLVIVTSLSRFQFNVIDKVFQKVQRYDDLIKTHAVR